MPFQKGCISWNKGRIGENSSNWKGGISKTMEYHVRALLKYRHKYGISKRYNSSCGLSYTKEYRRLYRKRYKYNLKRAGELTIQTIQIVYEDNIKKYGTLSCYLCLNPIPFGKDHLEHKIPLSRGGTNIRDNLDIACQRCNCSKSNKTETEYREEVLKK